MSSFELAIPITLAHEGGFTHEVNGDPVNMGLTLGFLRAIKYLGNPPRTGPASPSEIATIQGLSVVAAGQIYRNEIWNPKRCGEIEAQDVAAKFFDLSVNLGYMKWLGREVPEATVILQRACNVLANGWPPSTVSVDGLIGSATIWAVNTHGGPPMLAAIRSEGSIVYKQIADAHPDLRNRLGAIEPPSGWLGRLYS